MRRLRADKTLLKAAQTFQIRNAIYKDNWQRVGTMLAALFPNGLRLKSARDHERFHILMLVAVKLTRYSVAFERGERHRDSIHDAGVYCAMLEAIDDFNEQPKRRKKKR